MGSGWFGLSTARRSENLNYENRFIVLGFTKAGCRVRDSRFIK